MSTFTDGHSPPVNPGPGGEGPDEPEGADPPPGAGQAEGSPAGFTEPPGTDDGEHADPGSTTGPGHPLGAPPPPLPESGPLWLQEQMRKRMAENQASGRGRHARGDESDDQLGVDDLLARDGRAAELPGGYPEVPYSGEAPARDTQRAYGEAAGGSAADPAGAGETGADDVETAGIEQVPPPGAEPARRPRTRGSWQPDPYSPSGVRAPGDSGRFPQAPASGPPAGLPPPWYGAPPGPDADLQSTDVDAFAPIRFDADDADDDDDDDGDYEIGDGSEVIAWRAEPGAGAPALPFAAQRVEPARPAGSPSASPAAKDDGKRGKPGKEPADASSRSTPEPAPTRRVRVVLSERKGVARSVRTVVDIQEGTPVGALLSTNLIGSQLMVALRVGAVAAVTLGLLPALFAIFPELGRVIVLGIRLPWLLLGVLVYPFLLGLGWWHTRAAERVEQNFADHVQD